MRISGRLALTAFVMFLAGVVVPGLVQGQADSPRTGVFRGDALTWEIVARTDPGQEFSARSLVADWDRDGVDEILLPVINEGDKEVPIPLGRSAVFELDGSARLAPLNGFMLNRGSMVWDYDRDGFPEIATDTYGYAIVETTWRTRAVMTTADPVMRDEFESSEAIAVEQRKNLMALRPGSKDYFDDTDMLFSQLDNAGMKFDRLEYREFADWDEYNAAMGGITAGFELPSTVVVNLSGKKLCVVDGNLSDDPADMIVNVSGSKWPEMVTWEKIERDPEAQGRSLRLYRCYGSGGGLVDTLPETEESTLLGFADLDGNLVKEMLALVHATSPDGISSYTLKHAEFGKRFRDVDLSGAAEPSIYEWPRLCIDLDADGVDELISSDWHALNCRTHREYTLEKPEAWDGMELAPSAEVGISAFALRSTGPQLTWLATTADYIPTGIAAFRPDGRLEYFQEFGDRLLMLGTANGPDGVPYLLVQTATRLLVWPQDGKQQTGLQAGARLQPGFTGHESGFRAMILE